MSYRIASYASAGLLLLALGDWPYGFYTFLRIGVSATAFVGALQAFSNELAGWGVVLSGIAILFNPLIPIYLSQAAWAPIDVVCAGVIGVSPHHVIVGEESSAGSTTDPQP